MNILPSNILQEHLEFIRNKGNCQRTVDRAIQRLEFIKDTMEIEDYREISIELNHVTIGEGAAELNEVLKKVREKYNVSK